MRLKYFIDYRFVEKVEQFLPIGIWIQDTDDLGIDMFYHDETSDNYEEAMWVINRLVENNLTVPLDFLEYHQQRPSCTGMRSQILEAETKLNYHDFMKETLRRFADK